MPRMMALANAARSPNLPVPSENRASCGVPAGEQIGEPGDCQRGDVRRHVPAVGDERERAEQRAAGNLDDHHQRRQRHHAPGAPLVLAVMRAEKGVLVRPRSDGMRMHRHLGYGS